MVGMPFIIKMPFAGFNLRGDMLEHDGEDAVDGFGVGAVAVPDADEVVVEADGEGEAAEVVAWVGCLG